MDFRPMRPKGGRKQFPRKFRSWERKNGRRGYWKEKEKKKNLVKKEKKKKKVYARNWPEVKNDFAAGASFPNGFFHQPTSKLFFFSYYLFSCIFLDFYLVDVRRFLFLGVILISWPRARVLPFSLKRNNKFVHTWKWVPPLKKQKKRVQLTRNRRCCCSVCFPASLLGKMFSGTDLTKRLHSYPLTIILRNDTIDCRLFSRSACLSRAKLIHFYCNWLFSFSFSWLIYI